MGRIVFVTGGARSGKSMFAQDIASSEKDVAYVATAQAFDPEMEERISLHKSSRPESWTTYECPTDLARAFADKKHAFYLVDCLTVYISNAIVAAVDEDAEMIDMAEQDALEKRVIEELQGILDTIRLSDLSAVFVSNEVGMGLVPAYPMGRMFRDIAGRVNKLVAANADEAYLIVSGIPLKLK